MMFYVVTWWAVSQRVCGEWNPAGAVGKIGARVGEAGGRVGGAGARVGGAGVRPDFHQDLIS